MIKGTNRIDVEIEEGDRQKRERGGQIDREGEIESSKRECHRRVGEVREIKREIKTELA